MAILVVLFIVVPIVELYVIIQVGAADRRLADAGAAARRRRCSARCCCATRAAAPGAASTRRWPSAASPAREVADGLLIAIGGTLLLTPGFVTDIFGADPPDPADPGDRRGACCAASRSGASRWSAMPGGWRGFGRRSPARRAERDYDFDATAEEVPTNGDGHTPGCRGSTTIDELTTL